MYNKILLVDDEKHIRMLYTEELEAAGFLVNSVDGQSDILDDIKKYSPDIIILDIKLGERRSGLDLLQTIRSTNLLLPVILSTAYDSFQHDLKSLAADYYVVKSVDLTELIQKAKVAQIRLMLQGASLQKWKGELTQPFSDTLTYIDYSLRAYLGTALEGKEAFAIKSLQLTIKEFATDAISKNDIHAFIQIVHEQCLLLKKLLFIASKEASVIFMHNPKTSLKEFQDKVTAVCPESTKLYPELIRQLYDQASIAFVKRCKTVAENLKEAAEEVLQGNISGHLLDSMLLPLQYEPKVYNSMALQGEKIMDALLGSIRHDIFSLRSKVTRNYYKSRWDAFWGNTEAQQEKIALDREIDSIYKRLKSISGFPVRVGLVEVNIFRLIQNTLNSSFRGANIKLNCPPSSQQMTVFGDPTLVDIILRNILNNALEASAQNTAITIELSFKHDLSIVKILDNGCGIAEDDLPFIFDSGVSISKAKHTGEGLHIVKVLSDAMGFKIHVTSVPTQGTTVTITMPCKNVKLQN